MHPLQFAPTAPTLTMGVQIHHMIFWAHICWRWSHMHARRRNSILYDKCMGREIRQDTHVIVEMIFSLGGYHSSPRDAHAHKIDHIFARSAPRVPHRTAPNEMPKLLCMQNRRLFPQTHDTQHGAVQHVPFQSNATYALDKFLTIISTSISICGWRTNTYTYLCAPFHTHIYL